MPEHLERLGVAEDLIGPESYVESGDFSNCEVPGHFAVLAHPFRMLSGSLYPDVTVGAVFGEEAIVGLYAEGHAPIHLYTLPAPEAVELRGVLAPGAGLYHQVRRLLRLAGDLAEDRFLSAQCRIAEEEFNEKGFGFPCLGIITCEGMPPPVVSLVCLQPEELAGVAGYVMLVESCSGHI